MWLWQAELDGAKRLENDSWASLLFADVRRLRTWFAEHRRGPTSRLAWGFGSAFGPDAKEYPCLLLGWKALQGWRIRYRSSYADAPTSFAVASDFLVDEERARLRLPQLRLPLLVLIVSRPRPSSRLIDALLLEHLPTMEPLICAATGSQGSAGVSVAVAGHGPGILTAGHVFPKGVGSAVEVVKRGWIFKRRRSFGYIARHCSPLSDKSSSSTFRGWDAAVVIPSRKIIAPIRRPVCYTDVAEVARVEPVLARAGASGIVSGGSTMLRARLEEVDAGGISWKCVWAIFPAGVMTAGDSGASVFLTSSGELLGTYVGCSECEGKAQVHYVQDALSLERHVFGHWGVNF